MSIEPCSAPRGRRRPRLEVADIFRAAGRAYLARYAASYEQRRVMTAIEQCRTAVLGGHLDVCSSCGHQVPAYNSCRNRHCPKCQSLAQARWLAQRRNRIVPTKYFHVVFTLPQELRNLARVNPRQIYDLILESAARTLLEFGNSRLHAQLGITAVLHTWTRDLRLHPHAHCIVTAGGLHNYEGRWVGVRGRFLFPVRPMSKVFRGKFVDRLVRMYERGQLELHGPCRNLAEPSVFAQLIDHLYRKDWVVYAKQPFGGTEQVFEYLGRYTHRVGLSNRRLLAFDKAGVRFRTRHRKTATIEPVEFVRRFLLHVLPTGFVKIRHYGILSAANVTRKLPVVRRCLDEAAPSPTPGPPPHTPPTWRELLLALTGIDLRRCSNCHQFAVERQPLPSSAAARALDTS